MLLNHDGFSIRSSHLSTRSSCKQIKTARLSSQVSSPAYVVSRYLVSVLRVYHSLASWPSCMICPNHVLPGSGHQAGHHDAVVLGWQVAGGVSPGSAFKPGGRGCREPGGSCSAAHCPHPGWSPGRLCCHGLRLAQGAQEGHQGPERCLPALHAVFGCIHCMKPVHQSGICIQTLCWEVILSKIVRRSISEHALTASEITKDGQSQTTCSSIKAHSAKVWVHVGPRVTSIRPQDVCFSIFGPQKS